MGCCESAEEKQARHKKMYAKSGKKLIADVTGRADGTTNPSVFFASFIFGVSQGLHISRKEAIEFTEKCCKDNATAESAWRDYLDHIDSTRYDSLQGLSIRAWLHHDRDASGDLSEKEIDEVINDLNFPEKLEKELKEKVAKCCKESKVKELKFDQFLPLYESLIDWEELNDQWEAACEEGKPAENYVLSVEKLVKYLQVVQMQDNASDGDAIAIIDRYGAGKLNKAAFMRWITDYEGNCGYNVEATKNIYHDMTQPIAHYFINSSHNTYLSGDQFFSDSKPECYVNALLDNCRCVELDCWDGKEEGECIIYHGYTKTSRISFTSVIEAINKHAFATSDWPVILSLELHVSHPTQAKMAEIMKEIFSDRLAMGSWEPGQDADPLFTLENYKNKIIVKAKRCKPDAAVADEPSSEDDDEEEGEKKDKDQKNIKQLKEEQKAQDKKDGKDKKANKGTAKPLSDTVTMEAKHFKDFSDAEKAQNYEVCSFTESKSKKFAEKSLEEYQKYNKTRITRVYPAGHRVNSSNYHPQIHWDAGCQIVAFNWQTSNSYELRFNKGRFIDNGNCGYMLKPQHLRDHAVAAPTIDSTDIKIEFISAFALPKPEGESSGEVVDPYVKCFIEGPGQKGESAAANTETIDDNGFHPVWKSGRGSVAELHTDQPDMSTVVIQVYDKDIDADDFLAECFVPVHLLRQGVRSFPLKNEVGQDLTSSFVMARVTITKK